MIRGVSPLKRLRLRLRLNSEELRVKGLNLRLRKSSCCGVAVNCKG
jgi:hypothetical protein